MEPEYDTLLLTFKVRIYMRGTFRDNAVKEEVRKMRADGKTYKEIQEHFPIPKSTLSTWLAPQFPRLYTREKQLAHLKRIQPLGAAARHQARVARLRKVLEDAKIETANYPLHIPGFKKSMLAMLYWAEGAKHDKASGLKFVNTDPHLAQLYLTLLRHTYPLEETRLSIRLHLHYYHKITDTKKMWSDVLQVPLTQFTSTYIKKRGRGKRFRKNFAGICFIYYGDSRIREELLAIGRALCGIVAKS